MLIIACLNLMIWPTLGIFFNEWSPVMPHTHFDIVFVSEYLGYSPGYQMVTRLDILDSFLQQKGINLNLLTLLEKKNFIHTAMGVEFMKLNSDMIIFTNALEHSQLVINAFLEKLNLSSLDFIELNSKWCFSSTQLPTGKILVY